MDLATHGVDEHAGLPHVALAVRVIQDGAGATSPNGLFGSRIWYHDLILAV